MQCRDAGQDLVKVQLCAVHTTLGLGKSAPGPKLGKKEKATKA